MDSLWLSTRSLQFDGDPHVANSASAEKAPTDDVFVVKHLISKHYIKPAIPGPVPGSASYLGYICRQQTDPATGAGIFSLFYLV